MLILSFHGAAALELPANLQKIIDYNSQSTIDFSLKISIFIAFAAGILALLSPCILPLLPAFFSFTFKEKKNIAFMTIVFFFGFATSFVLMGVIAGYLGAQALTVIQQPWLVRLAGGMIILFGLLAFFGKGFSSFIKPLSRFGNDITGVYLFGVFFAIGWTACLGPILAGILGIGALLHSPLQSGVLLFFYDLGNLVPLFILSVFYDKIKASRPGFFQGRALSFTLLGKKVNTDVSHAVSGIIFIFLGLFMIIFNGTGPVNTWDILGTKQYFYSLQRELIGWQYAGIASILIFFFFLFCFGYFFWKRHPNKKER